MDYNSAITTGLVIAGIVCIALPIVAWLTVDMCRNFAKALHKPVRLPPGWQHDPMWFGDMAWVQIGRRCPELLGVVGERLLGKPVVDYLLTTADVPNLENSPNPLAAALEYKNALARGAESALRSTLPEEIPNADEPAPVFFKGGEPESLADYPGQEHVTTYLSALVKGLDPEASVPTEHQLLCGPAGQGKTLLVKCFAADLSTRNVALGRGPVQFLELVPADLETIAQQDAVLRRAQAQPTVLFIDEIHDLTERPALKLYMLLEEGRYRFEGDAGITALPDVCVVAATTDYGAMHAALKRRFNRHFLEPLNRTALEGILRRQPFPATAAAIQVLVDRTHFSGAPWEALQLYRQAKVFAKGRGATSVELQDAEQVFTAQGVDPLGLTRIDRRVISALLKQPRYRRGRDSAMEFVCYAASESDVVAMAGIDRGEYRDVIKPKLMARGLLQVRSTYGQSLTPKAVELYQLHARGLDQQNFSAN